MELSIMCDVHIIMCIFNTNGKKCAEFTTLPLQTLIDMYNKIPRKDISVFAPAIEVDKEDKTQKITPVEWGANTKDKLIKSAEIIRKRKEDVTKTGEGKKRDVKASEKSDEVSKSEVDPSDFDSKSKVSNNKGKAGKNSKAKGGKRTTKRRKVSDSDDDSENDNSAIIDCDMESEFESESKSKALENTTEEAVHFRNNPSSFGKIVFSTSPATNQHQNNNSEVNNNQSKKAKQDDSYKMGSELPSPGFNAKEEAKPKPSQTRIEEEKYSNTDQNKLNYKQENSSQIKQEEGQEHVRSENRRVDSVRDLNSVNAPSKNDDNHSFTFDHNNPATSSMKSPSSTINYAGIKKEHSISSPFGLKMGHVPHQLSSPNMLLGAFQNTAKNGNSEIGQKSPVPNWNQNLQMQKQSNLMQMLDEIGDLDESFAATKAAIHGKAYELEQGETEKTKKRKEKLKMKSKGLKLNIPAKNKFLPETTEPPKNNERLSPFRKIYTPTPTKKLMNVNVSDSGNDPMLFLNQLSNKAYCPVPKINLESPFMFLQESRCNPVSYNEYRFGTPNKFMSPMSQYPNAELLNISPYLVRPVVTKNYNYNNINVNHHYNKDADNKEDNSKEQ
jgi:hypothetical protein